LLGSRWWLSGGDLVCCGMFQVPREDEAFFMRYP
jgi:hypothetical protein